MKRLLLFLPALLLLAALRLDAQISSGNYRIPYASGQMATTLVDHLTHTLSNRVDLRGASGSTIVAADDGVVRFIRDNGPGGCGACTNYVWIQHSSGEWTGYFHLQQNSVTLTAGLIVGSNVVAGQTIGIEGTAGSPGGARLRFEVGVPANVNDAIVTTTGLLKGANLVPAICNITDNVLRAGRFYDPRSCFAQEFSYGVYRLPYTNGTSISFGRDHLTHAPAKTRLDLNGQGNGNNLYAIVAAAAGTIRMIVDSNTISCTGAGCSASNNYVWIAHPNGEWTKYTHFRTGSVRGNAGLVVGQNIAAGTYLGDEGAIGAAAGQHLHFEVGAPARQTLNDIDPAGGFLTNGPNRIPLFCDVPGNIGFAGDVFVAAPCTGGGCTDNILLTADTIRDTKAYVAADTVDSNNAGIRVDTYGSLVLMAGDKITLRPGFRAASESYMRAVIRPCNSPP